MEASAMSKFTRTPIPEVPLKRAPLDKVIMQVQFSRTPQLITDEADNVLSEHLGRYPVRRREINGGFLVQVNGQPLPMVPPTLSTVLSYAAADGSWTVSIAETSASIESTEYDNRDDFCLRAQELFSAIAAIALPPVVDRVGLRYINRLRVENLGRLADLVIPQLRGLHGAIDDTMQLHHSVTDTVLVVGENQNLQVRSGYLPPGAGFDPALPPVSEPSWLLDMDVSTATGGFAFDPRELTERLRGYAETAYNFFRFATTEEFLRLHEGATTATAGGDRA
jgi:uncharacterized protein (TIGR04255 family)